MMDIEKPLSKLLFQVSLARVRASAAQSSYEILGGKKQKKRAELMKSEFEYSARELRELLAYVEQEITYMEQEILL